MSEFIIRGGRRLRGALTVHGAKNGVLPILAASYLTDGSCTLRNCPDLSDVRLCGAILRGLGARVQRCGGALLVDAAGACGSCIPAAEMREMRSSIVFLGALLAKVGRATLCAPGGCDLGPRPIDLHLYAMTQLGAEIQCADGVLYCTAPGGLRGAEIRLPFPSVGATENALIASVTARGETRIFGAAREPEIDDLARFLNRCGARVSGIGTDTLEIAGVRRLHGASHTVLPDRIEAATYLTAAAMTGGDVLLRRMNPAHLRPVLDCLQDAGCDVRVSAHAVRLRAPQRLTSFPPVRTAPYPGFPTDAQALLMAAAAAARGTSTFEETVFSDRFRHVPALRRMGADIRTDGAHAAVYGVPQLHGAAVQATDLRGGAAMILAGLAADGVTTVADDGHIDRGYEKIECVLQSLGADIGRERIWQVKEKIPAPISKTAVG